MLVLSKPCLRKTALAPLTIASRFASLLPFEAGRAADLADELINPGSLPTTILDSIV